MKAKWRYGVFISILGFLILIFGISLLYYLSLKKKLNLSGACPDRISIDTAGNLYLVANGRLFCFSTTGGLILKGEDSHPLSDLSVSSGEKIYTITTKGSVVVFDKKGQEITGFSLRGVEGKDYLIEYDPINETLYVLNEATGVIQKYSHDGVLLASYDNPKERGLVRPRDLAIIGDKIYICDTENHRIQIFSHDLRPIDAIWFVNQPFPIPICVAEDEKGVLYVASINEMGTCGVVYKVKGKEFVGILEIEHTSDGPSIEVKGPGITTIQIEKALIMPWGLASLDEKLYIFDKKNLGLYTLNLITNEISSISIPIFEEFKFSSRFCVLYKTLALPSLVFLFIGILLLWIIIETAIKVKRREQTILTGLGTTHRYPGAFGLSHIGIMRIVLVLLIIVDVLFFKDLSSNIFLLIPSSLMDTLPDSLIAFVKCSVVSLPMISLLLPVFIWKIRLPKTFTILSLTFAISSSCPSVVKCGGILNIFHRSMNTDLQIAFGFLNSYLLIALNLLFFKYYFQRARYRRFLFFLKDEGLVIYSYRETFFVAWKDIKRLTKKIGKVEGISLAWKGGSVHFDDLISDFRRLADQVKKMANVEIQEIGPQTFRKGIKEYWPKTLPSVGLGLVLNFVLIYTLFNLGASRFIIGQDIEEITSTSIAMSGILGGIVGFTFAYVWRGDKRWIAWMEGVILSGITWFFLVYIFIPIEKPFPFSLEGKLTYSSVLQLLKRPQDDWVFVTIGLLKGIGFASLVGAGTLLWRRIFDRSI
jgi:hypothetical protein